MKTTVIVRYERTAPEPKPGTLVLTTLDTEKVYAALADLAINEIVLVGHNLCHGWRVVTPHRHVMFVDRAPVDVQDGLDQRQARYRIIGRRAIL